ncbi:hypothetical protein AB0L06_05030 [Spirillospora sp. NPDC052269]
MPEPDEIRPAEAAADPAPSAPPSFGHDEPLRVDGELRIPTPFRLQAPWWAAESPDSDEPESDESAQAGPPGAPAAGTPAPSANPSPDDRLVAGQGAPGVDSRRAVPRPETRAARETVPDGTPIHPPAGLPAGTGPQPMPLAAPVAPEMAALEANTDSRSSGPVLTPDAILPPGVTLPPAVVLPPAEKVVRETPKPDIPKPEFRKQDGRATATDMPVVPPTPQPIPNAAPPPMPSSSPAPPPPPPDASAGTPVPHSPFPGQSSPNASNDGNTGPQPFPSGPLGGGFKGNPASRRKLLIGGGVAAAIIAIGGVAVAGAVSGDDDGKSRHKGKHKTTAAPGVPGSPSPSGPVHHPVDINNEKSDTKPLALTEVFPSPAVQLAGHAFQRDRSSVNHQCGLTARGSMAAALAHDGCRAVVRVTFVSDDKKFAVTSGVAVLPNHEAALRVSRAGNPGKYEWFRGLTGPHAPDIDGAGGYAAATVRGRYVAYAYAAYVDGTHVTPQDTQIKGLAQQFLDYGTKALDARARG